MLGWGEEPMTCHDEFQQVGTFEDSFLLLPGEASSPLLKTQRPDAPGCLIRTSKSFIQELNLAQKQSDAGRIYPSTVMRVEMQL